MEKNQFFRKGQALLLLAAAVGGVMLGAGRPLGADAAVSGKTIAGLGTSVMANPTVPEENSAWKGSYVYFGKYNGEPVKYRVLDNNTTDFGGTTMLLDCDSILFERKFHDNSNVWADSAIRTYLNNTFLSLSYSSMEQNAIAGSTKTSAAGADGNGWEYVDYAPLSGEKIFLLDAKEASRLSYGYPPNQYVEYNSRNKDGGIDWWLRSPYTLDDSDAGYVRRGHIGSCGVRFSIIGVSPACNINLSSVLFSSVISGTAGQTGAEYKLTILDSGMNIAENGDVSRRGDTITIPCTVSGDHAGNMTQVSVLILDKEYRAGNTGSTNVLAYEKLEVDLYDLFHTGSMGTFTLPAELSEKVCGTDYYVYLVVERVNGQKQTDYASEPVAITIPEMKKVNSVQVTLDAPAAGQAFDTTPECGTEGIESVSAVWTDADHQPVSGNAGYNKAYTLKLTIIPADGYVLDSDTLIQFNDTSRTVENITLNPDDGTLSGTVAFQTARAKLLGIPKLADITSVANGAEKTAAALGLPDAVDIQTEDATVTTADVEWKIGEITQEQYDPSIQNREQTFVVNGTITLPEQIDNPEGVSLELSINITVLAADTADNPAADPVPKYAVTVLNGTGDGEYRQGQTVTITANDPEEGKRFVGWNVEGGAVILADSNTATTTFTMPAEAVHITAVYADELDVPYSPDMPDNPDTPTAEDSPEIVQPDATAETTNTTYKTEKETKGNTQKEDESPEAEDITEPEVDHTGSAGVPETGDIPVIWLFVLLLASGTGGVFLVLKRQKMNGDSGK